MGGTYTLVGALWDGLPTPPLPPSSDPRRVGDIPTIEMPKDLFDLRHYRRRLPSSVLFRITDERALQSLADRLAECDEVVIEVDSRPSAPGRIPQGFFEMRLRQVCGHLRDLLPGVRVELYDRRVP